MPHNAGATAGVSLAKLKVHTSQDLQNVSHVSITNNEVYTEALKNCRSIIRHEEIHDMMNNTSKQFKVNHSSGVGLDPAVFCTNETFINLKEFLWEHFDEHVFPSLRECQQECLRALRSGVILHEVGENGGNKTYKNRDYGPLMVTQPGAQHKAGPGQGKTISAFLAALLPLSSIPVEGSEYGYKAGTLGTFMKGVLTRQSISKNPGVEHVLNCIRHNNRKVLIYTTKDGQTRLMESSVLFGYGSEPADNFCSLLPDVWKLFKDLYKRRNQNIHAEKPIDRKFKAICTLFARKTKKVLQFPRQLNQRDKHKFVLETLLSGSIAYRENDCQSVHIEHLGYDLIKAIFKKEFQICKMWTSLCEPVLIGRRLYMPLMWILARTVVWSGGVNTWRVMAPIEQYDNFDCSIEAEIQNCVLLIGCWGTMRSQSKGSKKKNKTENGKNLPNWIQHANFGMLIRDEAHVASDETTKTEIFLKEHVEIQIPAAIHFSSTLDINKTKMHSARSTSSARKPNGFPISDSVKNSNNQPATTSLPHFIMYDPKKLDIYANRQVQHRVYEAAAVFRQVLSIFYLIIEENMRLAGYRIGKKKYSNLTKRERKYHFSLCRSFPLVGLCSFATSQDLNNFKEQYIVHTKKSSYNEKDSFLDAWIHHACNRDGRGFFSGYFHSKSRKYRVFKKNRPLLIQKIVPIISTADTTEIYDLKSGCFKKIPATDVHLLLNEGKANFLMVLHKHLQCLNVPHMQYAIILRSEGTSKQTFLQAQGRISRNPIDQAAIRSAALRGCSIVAKSSSDKIKPPSERIKRDIERVCRGTGNEQRMHTKFFVQPDTNSHIILAAQALFENGFSMNQIQDDLANTFECCSKCGKPLKLCHVDSLGYSTPLLCKADDPCLDICLPSITDCYPAATDLIGSVSHVDCLPVHNSALQGCSSSNGPVIKVESHADSEPGGPRSIHAPPRQAIRGNISGASVHPLKAEHKHRKSNSHHSISPNKRKHIRERHAKLSLSCQTTSGIPARNCKIIQKPTVHANTRLSEANQQVTSCSRQTKNRNLKMSPRLSTHLGSARTLNKADSPCILGRCYICNKDCVPVSRESLDLEEDRFKLNYKLFKDKTGKIVAEEKLESGRLVGYKVHEMHHSKKGSSLVVPVETSKSQYPKDLRCYFCAESEPLSEILLEEIVRCNEEIELKCPMGFKCANCLKELRVGIYLHGEFVKLPGNGADLETTALVPSCYSRGTCASGSKKRSYRQMSGSNDSFSISKGEIFNNYIREGRDPQNKYCLLLLRPFHKNEICMACDQSNRTRIFVSDADSSRKRLKNIL